jgi:Zn-dependent M28 family amino/carboxypeptidase
MKRLVPLIITLIIGFLFLAVVFVMNEPETEQTGLQSFDPQRAYQDVINQVRFGPRTPGSQAHTAAVDYIQNELVDAGWEVELQQLEYNNHPIKNIIARRGSGSPLTLLGAHYDSRLSADRDPDPDKRVQPVPGANDGASGVAVLLELGRVLPAEIQGQIWLVFFDLEDQGNLPGFDWILGSRAFATQLEQKPDSVVILDMIGDADLNVYLEKNSTVALREEIWAAAERLSYEEYLLPQVKYSILDDHTPFLELGIPAVDLIDFDYPYYHTTQDTADKVSPESLKIIGETILEWLLPIITVGKN